MRDNFLGAVGALMVGAALAGCSEQNDQKAEQRPRVASTDEDRFEIPSRFWGEYNELLSDCGTGRNDSRLQINSNRVRFYESNGFLREIYHLEDGSVVILADSSGEGQTWDSTYRLSLDETGNKLTLHFPRSADMESFSALRFRCPNPTS